MNLLAVAGPHPTIVPLVVAMGLAVAAITALVIVMVRDGGADPRDVALGYETAWDHLDFRQLWILAGDELRDGRSRTDFVRDKQAAYARGEHLRRLASAITAVEVRVDRTDPDRAFVVTAIDGRDGTTIHNHIRLARRDGVWRVVAYELAPTAPASSTPPAARTELPG